MAHPVDRSNPPSNEQLARSLDQMGDLLAAQGANPSRVQAYQHGAQTLRALKEPVHRLVETEGVAGLELLPGIGRSLARAVAQLVRAGRFPLLERLLGEHVAEKLFASVPEIGEVIARRVHDQLGVETLPDLEAAARDGRLSQVPGMGPKRIQAVRDVLATRLRHRAVDPDARRGPPAAGDQPPVAELLSLDAEYRRQATADKLPKIAPRRFNRTGAAWLPIWHAGVDDRHYTLLFSNTARAREAATTRDWVVIYRDDAGGDGRWTVITAAFGALRGKRVVRGREAECAEHHQHTA